LVKDLSILFIFTNNQLFVSLILCIILLASILLILSSSLLCLSIYCFWVWLVHVFLSWRCIVIFLGSVWFFIVGAHSYNLPSLLLLLCPIGNGKLCLHLHLILGIFFILSFISLMDHWSFKSELFGLQVLVYFL
jgi:hypothetical protein